MKTELKKLPKSQIEIDFELDEQEFQKHVDRALLHLKEHVKMDGFRPGQVPLKVVEEKVGKENLLMEAGDLAVKESYTRFLNENNLEPIGEPDVQILKIAKGNPFLFKVTVTVLPEINLPDYKEIASRVKTNEIHVDEKEVEHALNHMQKSRAKFSQVDLPAPRPNTFYVYAIKCDNDSLYIGQTEDLKKRWQEHQTGNAADWTKKHKPLYIAHYEEYSTREEAVKRESDLKTGFGRKWLKREIETGRARQAGRGAEKKDFIEIEYQNENINNGKEIKDGFVLGEGGFLKDFEDNLMGMKTGEEKEFTAKFPENAPNKTLAGKDSKFKVKVISVQKMELPEISDEFAKSLGNFENLAVLKENLKEGITMEKAQEEKQRKRSEILEKITEKIKSEIPEKVVEAEERRLFENFKNQAVQNFNLTFEEYLAAVKRTEEEIRKSFKPEAEKRVKNYLILRQIGKKENIDVQKDEIEEEMNKFIKNHSKEQFEKIDIEQLKEYTKDTIFNEKVFQKLESFSK